jgi:multiple sugar transport system ATP-binding protein
LRSRLDDEPGNVLVGLRPEALSDALLAGADPDHVLTAKVEITEQLGPETLAYVQVEGLETLGLGERPVELAGTLAARLDPRTQARAGESIELAIDLEQLHLFDGPSGVSLLR